MIDSFLNDWEIRPLLLHIRCNKNADVDADDSLPSSTNLAARPLTKSLDPLRLRRDSSLLPFLPRSHFIGIRFTQRSSRTCEFHATFGQFMRIARSADLWHFRAYAFMHLSRTSCIILGTAIFRAVPISLSGISVRSIARQGRLIFPILFHSRILLSSICLCLTFGRRS